MKKVIRNAGTRKHFLWMLVAILTLCSTTTVMTSCGDSDDDLTKEEANTNDNVAAKAEVTYYVDLGDNTLELADVEVTYLDETNHEKTIKMTQKQWTLKRTLAASQLPADFSLKVEFEQKYDVTPEDDKDYEFGCVSRIPFKVYNSKGEKICDHPGAVAVSDGSHPTMKGSQMSGWWLSYALGINPDKLLNFDKKTLTVKSDRAEFNDMDYKYPYTDWQVISAAGGMSVHEGAIATALRFIGELEQVKKPEAVEYKRMMEKGWSKIDKNSM